MHFRWPEWRRAGRRPNPWPCRDCQRRPCRTPPPCHRSRLSPSRSSARRGSSGRSSSCQETTTAASAPCRPIARRRRRPWPHRRGLAAHHPHDDLGVVLVLLHQPLARGDRIGLCDHRAYSEHEKCGGESRSGRSSHWQISLVGCPHPLRQTSVAQGLFRPLKRGSRSRNREQR